MPSFLEKLTGKATAALQQQVAELTTQIEQLTGEKTELERLLAEAIAANEELQKQVQMASASAQTLASVKAFEITAAQGVPPVTTSPKQDTTAGQPADVFAAYLEITDPKAAAEFYAANIAPKLAGGSAATK
jgi:hypothetical protein